MDAKPAKPMDHIDDIEDTLAGLTCTSNEPTFVRDVSEWMDSIAYDTEGRIIKCKRRPPAKSGPEQSLLPREGFLLNHQFGGASPPAAKKCRLSCLGLSILIVAILLIIVATALA